ncbi:MAG: MarR family transcriptional regulator [Candidatus Omnitrophica bacterium]|nr:MarR family transcriptional regulator [Candidatus Omnitrophota bacterium]
MVSVKEVAREVSVLVPKLMMSMKSERFLKNSVTTHQQMITIMQINTIGPCKISKVADKMGVSAPTMTGLIDRLQRMEYVERFRDKKDRRIIFVKVTRKGAKLVQQLKEIIQRRWEVILGYLTVGERTAYANILRKIISALSKHEN